MITSGLLITYISNKTPIIELRDDLTLNKIEITDLNPLTSTTDTSFNTIVSQHDNWVYLKNSLLNKTIFLNYCTGAGGANMLYGYSLELNDSTRVYNDSNLSYTQVLYDTYGSDNISFIYSTDLKYIYNYEYVYDILNASIHPFFSFSSSSQFDRIFILKIQNINITEIVTKYGFYVKLQTFINDYEIKEDVSSEFNTTYNYTIVNEPQLLFAFNEKESTKFNYDGNKIIIKCIIKLFTKEKTQYTSITKTMDYYPTNLSGELAAYLIDYSSNIKIPSGYYNINNNPLKILLPAHDHDQFIGTIYISMNQYDFYESFNYNLGITNKDNYIETSVNMDIGTPIYITSEIKTPFEKNIYTSNIIDYYTTSQFFNIYDVQLSMSGIKQSNNSYTKSYYNANGESSNNIILSDIFYSNGDVGIISKFRLKKNSKLLPDNTRFSVVKQLAPISGYYTIYIENSDFDREIIQKITKTGLILRDSSTINLYPNILNDECLKIVNGINNSIYSSGIINKTLSFNRITNPYLIDGEQYIVSNVVHNDGKYGILLILAYGILPNLNYTGYNLTNLDSDITKAQFDFL